jgi:hypothetical protein
LGAEYQPQPARSRQRPGQGQKLSDKELLTREHMRILPLLGYIAAAPVNAKTAIRIKDSYYPVIGR